MQYIANIYILKENKDSFKDHSLSFLDLLDTSPNSDYVLKLFNLR